MYNKINCSKTLQIEEIETGVNTYKEEASCMKNMISKIIHAYPQPNKIMAYLTFSQVTGFGL